MVNKKKKVEHGMWKGSEGLPYGAEFNAPERLLALSDLEGMMRDATSALESTEKLIDMVSEILSISQPPISGMLGVRWWKLTGQGRFREPVLVRWELQKNGRRRPVKAINYQVRSTGNYALNAAETKEAAMILKNLIADRKSIKNRLANVRRIMSGLRGHEMFAENEKERLDSIKRRVIQNLLRAGYDVEDKYLPKEDAGGTSAMQ